jgi:hypothetical protein
MMAFAPRMELVIAGVIRNECPTATLANIAGSFAKKKLTVGTSKKAAKSALPWGHALMQFAVAAFAVKTAAVKTVLHYQVDDFANFNLIVIHLKLAVRNLIVSKVELVETLAVRTAALASAMGPACAPYLSPAKRRRRMLMMTV